ncbi:MAG: tRNA uridine-5-carboxymethylaminomethyl(34) synthesis enzyme MnmG [Leptolyngbya sp. PLA2]|nr:tRNA uridine-5-carboxymethylaminomethyl(34) synthesis enzyme MnmG [Leptolyngbya sp.]MCE7972544.1 tRNA uridine-5-carboxymethylaminomethyl(34) synthesis enzyme MnmG [Leptolyngbya sp. PL-A2]MCZ7632548.1 tRNA uridine-5-carboxymethylaminomethyl(34) synthesis enzyme MnmG [Phycisphaerales bacterium]MDL1904994.1 tRNA uridine-5-carboxymethylaminomethyl(34) synthesis enzyme MnmG [Synechococcales cyanobacterium CNB]GIK19894.1 MAG: tRNA uridine 5-carboxymethylaminomethyl modification enzyme MnmG [Planct
MAKRSYRVIVIGGGHAGVEAAWAAANLLPAERDGAGRPVATVALVTLDASKIGVMSCNPAIGGLAKGQLVREIDAMGGLMGLAADATGIQFKVLNTSKGPAVHGPRCQSDKHAYADAVQALIRTRPEIDVIEGSVERLEVGGGRVKGVVIGKSQVAGLQIAYQAHACLRSDLPSAHLPFAVSAPAVVLTTGTFMRGLMHTGESKTPGGRHGESAAVGISAALRELGFELGRLKTGTPPRLRRASIDWDALDPALGDDPPVPFSDLSGRGAGQETWGCLARFPVLPQVECRQTRTSPEAHAAIRANLHRAPMFSGQIESIGPRYCPSIEDKVVRFADRETHGVFLEPESLRDDSVYCNGISTSLPTDVQDVIVRTMPGCEQAEILRYGYAVEYDMVRPHQIMPTGMTRPVEGLFLAGQINGTSGYEEAAAQGLIAGINAARFATGESEFTLGRDEAYIGVLMDDLVTKTPVEPYRMFTSRAEHRLLLRADNASDRLTPTARRLGLLAAAPLGRRRLELFEQRGHDLATINAAIDATRIDSEPLARVMRRQDFTIDDLRRSLADRPGLPPPDSPAWVTAHADRRYAAYVDRQRAEVRRHAEMERRPIPDTVDFASLVTLRAEARESLARFRPRTFGQASRLEGVTPADLTLLAVLVYDRPAASRRRG